MIDITEYEKTYKGKYKVRLYVNEIGYSSEIMTLSYHSAMGDDSYGTGAFNPAYIEFSLYTDNVIEAGQAVQLQLGAYKYEDVLDDEGKVIGQKDVTTMYQIGVFYCEKPVVDGNTVSVTAYDTLKYNFDGIYITTITDDSTQTINIINDVCTQAGVQFLNQGGISTVEWQPNGFNGMSYREVLMELANYNGLNVCSAPSGKVTMRPYKITDFVYPLSDCTDVLISTDKITNGLEAYDVGSVKIFDFCPFLQAGDIITVGEYKLPMVALSFDYETTCTAEIESKIRNDYENAPSVSERFEDVDNKVDEIDNKVDEVDKKADRVEEASVEFSNAMNNAMGLFRIYQDGKTYYANKRTLDEATYIFTMTDAGFAWADAWNGDETVWNYGIDRNGNAILRSLMAYKISADIIETGTINSVNKDFTQGSVAVFDLDESRLIFTDKTENDEAGGVILDDNMLFIGQVFRSNGKYLPSSGFVIIDDVDGNAMVTYRALSGEENPINRGRTLGVSAITYPMYIPNLMCDKLTINTDWIEFNKEDKSLADFALDDESQNTYVMKCKYRKQLGKVELCGIARVTYANLDKVMATLPEGYRPKRTIAFKMGFSTDVIVHITINSDGEITPVKAFNLANGGAVTSGNVYVNLYNISFAI